MYTKYHDDRICIGYSFILVEYVFYSVVASLIYALVYKQNAYTYPIILILGIHMNMKR